jgi:hypothetical protein
LLLLQIWFSFFLSLVLTILFFLYCLWLNDDILESIF